MLIIIFFVFLLFNILLYYDLFYRKQWFVQMGVHELCDCTMYIHTLVQATAPSAGR